MGVYSRGVYFRMGVYLSFYGNSHWMFSTCFHRLTHLKIIIQNFQRLDFLEISLGFFWDFLIFFLLVFGISLRFQGYLCFFCDLWDLGISLGILLQLVLDSWGDLPAPQCIKKFVNEDNLGRSVMHAVADHIRNFLTGTFTGFFFWIQFPRYATTCSGWGAIL